jgi:hypothetical protein
MNKDTKQRIEKAIYKLKLHEAHAFDDLGLFTTVLRVPGGWFYRSYDKSHNIATGVFVPFDTEFQDEE